MFLKSTIQGVDRLVHNGLVYKAVDGIIHVPGEIHNEIGSFGVWQPVTEPLDKKTVAALEKSTPEELVSTIDGDVTPPEPPATPE